MTIDEQHRFELHVGLRHVLGDDVATTLMEHLPPGGWSDVARTSDIEHLRDHFDTQLDRIDDRFARVDDRFAHLGAQIDGRFARVDDRFAGVDRRLDSIVRGLWTIGTAFAGAFIALFSLIATKF